MLAGAKVVGGPGGAGATGGTYTKCVAGDVAQVATQCWSRSPPSCSSSAMATGWTASVATAMAIARKIVDDRRRRLGPIAGNIIPSALHVRMTTSSFVSWHWLKSTVTLHFSLAAVNV